MTTLGNRRIGKPDAERLLNGEPAGAEHAALAALLSAAAAPGRPGELTDEPAMVAAFVRAYQDPSPRRVRAWRPGRRFTVVKVAAGVVLFTTVGTAVAAETGSLPAGLQRHAHDLFSPLGVPTPTSDGTATVRPGAGPSTPGGPAASPAPPTPVPGEAAAAGLCRAWAAAQRDPHGNAMAPEQLRELVAAAGGVADIPAFCAEKIDGGASASAAPPAAPVMPTPGSRPGGGGKPGGDPPGHGGDPPGKGNGPPGDDGGHGPRGGTTADPGSATG